MVGLSHHSASLDARERLAVSVDAWHEVNPASPPCVLLSTCNRIEVYAWGDGSGLRCAGQLRRGLARTARISLAELDPYLVTATGERAILHLVRVAAGLDSLIVREDQIRGQVRTALSETLARTPLPAPLMGVFQRAFQAARSLRLDSPVGHHRSVAVTGVEVALRAPELLGRTGQQLSVLVVGAGTMARSALAHLVGIGAPVTLLNRTVSHAVHLAEVYGPTVAAASLETLPEWLAWADLVVCGTASRRPVLGRGELEAALRLRSARPLVVLDVGMPRDVEPSARTLPGVRLIDLDDLERMCPVGTLERIAEQERLEGQAAEAARAIDSWLRVRARSPEIVQLRCRGQQIRSEELTRVAPRLKDLSPAQISAVEELTQRLVNKLLHAPTVALRERASRRGLGAQIA
jgi:glutamyl-tRNA reductase